MIHRSPRGREPAPRCRRRLVVRSSVLLAAPWLGWADRVHAKAYPATVMAMKVGRDTETSVYYHYAEYGRHARREGYLGIAYLFTAVAASEMVHATNFFAPARAAGR